MVFATTVFDDAATGPGVFAQYLWRELSEDSHIEFHLVCPSARLAHPRLHLADGPGHVYARVASKAREVARTLREQSAGAWPILHVNAAHAAGTLLDYAGPWLVQVNDYEVADLWPHAAGVLLRAGLRKLASLVWRRGQERRAVRAATRVVCNSDCTRRAVLRAYHADAGRTVTIHKAVQTGDFQQRGKASVGQPPQHDSDPGAFQVSFVGTNWRIKGLDVLLRAMTRVADSVRLVVAGSPDLAGNAPMVRLAGRLGLGDRVTFAGRLDRPALARLLWSSGAMVLPSRQEAFGVAVLEALAAGVPVIASRTGGIGEIVRDGQEGLLVGVGDDAALARAITTLACDGALRARLARAGPARAEEFSLGRMIHAYRTLYADLAQ